ncbi:Type I transmembrane sorting receptor [Xylographa bjoerkii]|nr:Type I transmembrane sorting receptor [Xylographa bjoerkii]
MPSLKSVVAIAALCCLSSAAPFKTGFTIKEAPRDTELLLSGPRSLLMAYEKYGVQPPELVRRAALTGIGTVTATPTEDDSEYLISVEISSPSPIGSAPQTFTLDVDTSSSTFALYGPKYGASGATVTKTVDIGGAIVTGQAISLISDSSGASNLVGLLYAGKNFYTNAVASAANGYAIGTAAFVAVAIDTIVDTGTTLLLLLPAAVVKAYYSKVAGAAYSADEAGYIFSCAATLPKFTLGIAAYKAVVPGPYLNYAPVNSTYCYGGIQENTGIGFSICGLTFVKSQFVVFAGTTAPTRGFAAKPT